MYISLDDLVLQDHLLRDIRKKWTLPLFMKKCSTSTLFLDVVQVGELTALSCPFGPPVNMLYFFNYRTTR